MNTLEYLLEKYPNKPWDWSYITANSNITIDFIEKHMDKPWDWDWISRNPNITMEFIEKHPDKPWNWWAISNNQNIKIDIMENNIEEINFGELSINKFTYQNKLNKINKGILALEHTKNRFPKDVNMYIVKHYL